MNVFSKSGKRGHEVVVSQEEAVKVIDGLKPETELTFVKNPKRQGTAAYDRYTGYSAAKTVAEYLESGGNKADFMYDLQRGFVTVK